MIISVKKMLNMLVRSVQNWSISREIFPENSYEIGNFFTDCFFVAKLALKISVKSLWNQPIFRAWTPMYFHAWKERF